MLTDEQLAKMNAYAKEGKALRSTLRMIVRDLTKEYKALRDSKGGESNG
ncbi:hypothetical protein [Cohnella nanjingensis]|uniref:Uncharacterized protein n=1 Tax=Cohnella nanjingensis TaxID=1387779 RepID=A0A7X0VG87_9BACL|nr:hypothetical protein [Cohnella nanjingensis]MBB6672596.1 hypothetical protein [Cohnella nanjingensis]